MSTRPRTPVKNLTRKYLNMQSGQSFSIALIYYLLLSFIKFQTKCRHSLHEFTKIVGELLLDNVYLVEKLTIAFNEYKQIKTNNYQLAFW